MTEGSTPRWSPQQALRALALVVMLAGISETGRAQPAREPPNTGAVAAVEARFRHVTLFVTDNERVARWYQEMLGMALDARFTLRRPDGARIEVVRLRLGPMLMHVSALPDLRPRERGIEYQGWRHVSFAVADVDEAWRRMRDRGADVVGTGAFNFDPPGYRVAFVRDPEGNMVELYQDGVR